MKKLLFHISILISFSAFSQVGINTTNVHTSAVFEIKSENQGFAIPIMTTAQREAITNPPDGLNVFDSDLDCLLTYYLAKAAWVGNCTAIEPKQNKFPYASSIRVRNNLFTAVSDVRTYTLTVGQTLIVEYTYTDDENDLQAGATIKWYRADDPFGNSGLAEITSNLNNTTYVTTALDEGKFIFCTIVLNAATGSTPSAAYKTNGAYVQAPIIHNGLEYRGFYYYEGILILDRNVGATRVAQSINDDQAYGYYFQWGRPKDGHEQLDLANTNRYSGQATGITGGPWDGKFVTATPSNWTATPIYRQWDVLGTGSYEVCPTGFGVITAEGRTTIRIDINLNNPTLEQDPSQSSQKKFTALSFFNSIYKIPASGYRSGTNGTYVDRGVTPYLWTVNFDEDPLATPPSSSIVMRPDPTIFQSDPNASFPKKSGIPVRCAKFYSSLYKY